VVTSDENLLNRPSDDSLPNKPSDDSLNKQRSITRLDPLRLLQLISTLGLMICKEEAALKMWLFPFHQKESFAIIILPSTIVELPRLGALS
jgi:hypothetical protein